MAQIAILIWPFSRGFGYIFLLYKIDEVNVWIKILLTHRFELIRINMSCQIHNKYLRKKQEIITSSFVGVKSF